jgi:predicted O-methyltransferase YrrM
LYSSFQLAKKYIQYYLTASNGKGHGIHSPFVFDFIKFVLNDQEKYACYPTIESLRKGLLNDDAVIEVEDFGAGSSVIKTNKRIVSKMAASSLKSKKYAQLLHRIVQYYKPQTIIELGTSFGITTSYLAYANENGVVYTMEGAAAIAGIATKNFTDLSLRNIKLIQGDFEQTMPSLLASLPKIDLAFIDGNHRKAPTLQYFRQLLNHSGPSAMLIFDDIHWSAEMEEAWEQIQHDSAVTLTIDLFFIGLVFINPDFKVKQHFKIRF